MRYMLTDDLWAALGPHVRQAKRHKGGQPPALPEQVIDRPDRFDHKADRSRPLSALRHTSADEGPLQVSHIIHNLVRK